MRTVSGIAGIAVLAGLAWLASAGSGPDLAPGTPVPAIVPAPAATAMAAPVAIALDLPRDIPAWPRAPKPIARPAAARREPAAPPAEPEMRPKGAGPAAVAAGWFSVKTNPPFARVFIDGEQVGTTPLAAPIQLPSGTHALRLLREGCLPLEREIEVQAADTSFLRISLERAP